MKIPKVPETEENWGKYPRIFVVFTAIILLIINSLYNVITVQNDVAGVNEAIPKIFDDYNIFLRNNSIIRNLLLIALGVLQDTSLLSMTYFWIIYSKNWRPFIAVVLTITMKIICDFVLTMKPNEDEIFSYPGFPSLVIPYGYTFNYFFSLPLALNIISVLELFTIKSYWFSSISLVSILFYIMIMFSLKAQYLLSIFAGIFAGHYFFIIGNKLKHTPDSIYNLEKGEFMSSLGKQEVRNIKYSSIS